eukprot:scaffold42206_cov32-Prasinocladus_malaysianus.AAC.2
MRSSARDFSPPALNKRLGARDNKLPRRHGCTRALFLPQRQRHSLQIASLTTHGAIKQPRPTIVKVTTSASRYSVPVCAY